MRSGALGWRLALGFGALACGSEAPERPQLLVFIDTDAASIGQLESGLSPAAAVDVVRIEELAQSGAVLDRIETGVSDPSDFPISFGVAGKGRVRLRIRAFSAVTAVRVEAGGVVDHQPSPRLSIERVVELDVPSAGKQGALVLLSADCFGRPASYEPPRTCSEGAEVAFDQGITSVAPDARPVSRVGSSVHAQTIPCESADPNRVCIPGGLTVLGSDELADVVLDSGQTSPAPARLVWLSPFTIDRRELTVGRFRSLLAEHPDELAAHLPELGVPNTIHRDCTWLGPSDASHDDYPLNCIETVSAARVCELLGGTLPSEAEWERAARGPGGLNRYPWGDRQPACCTASFGRDGSQSSCGEGTVEVGGSHPPDAGCDGIGDRTAEGVDDMGGSLAESTRDRPQRYDEPCWSAPGIAVDPLCTVAGSFDVIVRGGAWSEEGIKMLSALRDVHGDTSAFDFLGFRCVYPP